MNETTKGKLTLTMMLQVQECSAEDAINDVHQAMMGFGQSLQTPERELEVIFVPVLKVPVGFEDLLAFESVMGNAHRLLARQQTIATNDDERAIVAVMGELKNQHNRVREVTEEYLRAERK